MAWYNNKGKEPDVVISSRVRYARNIADYPFYNRLDNTSANEIIQKIKEADGGSCSFIDFTNMDDDEAASYVERHYVSPEFAASKLPHALLLNEEKGVAVMLVEEDHMRVQCIKAGLALDEANRDATEELDKLESVLNIAFDEKLGYLTHCPTNLGTAMRASVMMFLPALTMNGQIGQLSAYLQKTGMTIRGMYGEGSAADGYMYQISNRVTLGISEDDIIAKLSETIGQIIATERKARETLKSDNADKLEDICMRSFGIMSYAKLMTSKEFLKLSADVRLGMALGWIDGMTYEKLNALMIEVSPATLSRTGGGMDESARDRARAAAVNGGLRQQG